MKPFNLKKYIGDPDNGIPAPYSPARLAVMTAGAAGLYLALLQPTDAKAWREARANAAFNAIRFKVPRRKR